MRLYFFPALLPLAPLLPVLLTALAAVAGIFRRASKGIRSSRFLGFVSAGLLVSALALFAWQRTHAPSSERGSRLTPQALLPGLIPRDAMPAAVPQGKAHAEGLLVEKWSRFGGQRILSAALGREGILWVGAEDASLQAISAATGEVLWSLRKKEPILSPAAVGDGVAYVGEGLHTASISSLTALESKTGKVLWQREFAGHIESAPLVDEVKHRLFAVTGPAGLWAIGTRDGHVLWHAALGHVDSTPLLGGGSLWVTAQPNEKEHRSVLHELDPETGADRFELPLEGQPWGEPLIEGDRLYVSTGVGQIGREGQDNRGWSHALNLGARKIAWSTDLGAMPLPRSSLTREGLLIHTLKSGEVVALDTRDGKIAWRVSLGSSTLSEAVPIQGDQWLAALPTAGSLHLIDPRSGRILQKTDAGLGSPAAPLYKDGVLFAIGASTIVAFEVRDR